MGSNGLVTTRVQQFWNQVTDLHAEEQEDAWPAHPTEDGGLDTLVAFWQMYIQDRQGIAMKGESA